MTRWQPGGAEGDIRYLLVPGEPLTTARPRVTRHGTYTPKESLAAQRKVREAFLALGLSGHVADDKTRWGIYLQFYRSTKYRRDIDNLAKTVLDGLTGALYTDDRQVDHLTLDVLHGVDKDAAGTFIAFVRLER